MQRNSSSNIRYNCRAFSLVEIMIVVSIVGLLAAMASISFSQYKLRVQATTFFSNLRVNRDQLIQCVMETDSIDVAAAPGQLSPAFEPYVSKKQWSNPTVVGGLWDVDSNSSTGFLAIGVSGFTSNTDVIDLIEHIHDDGNTNTGNLRILGPGKFYWVIEP